MHRLQIVGGGQMGTAIAAGLLENGWAEATEIHVVEPSASRADALADLLGGVSISGAPVASEGTLLAVKPDVTLDVIPAVTAAGGGRLLSIAAGVTVGSLEAAAPADAVILRAMPNTPALAGAGTSALCGGTHAVGDDITWAEGLLGSVGRVFVVSESDMDAVTAVSGSGPAYIFMVAEALIDAAVLSGLGRGLAQDLVTSMIDGSGTLMSGSESSAAELRAAVTSPGGTTATAVAVLESFGLRAAFSEAVSAAKVRSEELGS